MPTDLDNNESQSCNRPNDASPARPDMFAQAMGQPDAPPLELPNEQLFRSLPKSAIAIMYHFLTEYGVGNPCYIKTKEIEADTGISLTTVKRALTRLEEDKLITKKHYRNMADQGLEIVLLPVCEEYRLFLRAYPIRNSPVTRSLGRPVPRLIDRKEISSLPSDILQVHQMKPEAFAESFPNVHKAEFRAFQLAEIAIKRTRLGEDCTYLVQGLRYVDYAIEHDLMRTKDGDPIQKPVNWIYSILLRQGYYPKPVGYMTPEEMAAQDAQESLRKIKAAKKARKESQFQAWLEATPKARLNEIIGRGRGPEESRLRFYWEKHEWNQE